LSGFNRISSNWLCVKPSSPHAGGSSKICSICCFYATALLGLNHKQIRRPAITSAFGFLLRIIALGKYKWEYFYIGGFIEGMRRWEILTQMVSWGSVVRCFNFDELVKSWRRALTKMFNWFDWLDWLLKRCVNGNALNVESKNEKFVNWKPSKRFSDLVTAKTTYLYTPPL
jgi:hypothetical protein